MFVCSNLSELWTRVKGFWRKLHQLFLQSGFEGSRTGLWGTLWQVKSQIQRSSSASSSHEPPNMRQRSCSQLSTPEPEPPEPQSAENTHKKYTIASIKHIKHTREMLLYQCIMWKQCPTFISLEVKATFLYSERHKLWIMYISLMLVLGIRNQRRSWSYKIMPNCS